MLLHGNGTMIEDMVSSELVARAQYKYRVILFDRPGFGHSSRPRNVIWTADAQAELFRKALHRLGVLRAIVLGHSWGASVAMALALRHPDAVKGLVLASGYYYPTGRVDVAILGAPAIPVLGDIMSYTVSPLAARLLWPRIKRKMFGPQQAPEKFDGVPTELIFRPSQLRAGAAEAALMIPDAAAAANRYSSLKMPVVIIAGEEDGMIDIDEQSARLHRNVLHSALHRLAGAGHMIHQTETASILKAIGEASATEVSQADENRYCGEATCSGSAGPATCHNNEEIRTATSRAYRARVARRIQRFQPALYVALSIRQPTEHSMPQQGPAERSHPLPMQSPNGHPHHRSYFSARVAKNLCTYFALFPFLRDRFRRFGSISTAWPTRQQLRCHRHSSRTQISEL